VVDTYIGFSLEEPPDFDIVYKQRQGKAEDEEFKAHVKTLHTILDDLFTNAFRLWYEQRGAARQLDFRRLYEQRLISDELQERFEGSFPQCRGRHWIRFPELGPQGFRTFVYDLDELEFKKVVGHSDVITHGDLNGRNILIHEGKPWPIDFYHTGPGHLLRDFVKLESCIKFELMETESPEALRQFEDVLNMPYPPEADLSFAYHWNPEDLIKAYRVITHLRELAVREAKASWTQIRDEYYIGLFYQTLAVLQYSIREARKKHALLSANKIYDLVTA
jgi:hypothetical protein